MQRLIEEYETLRDAIANRIEELERLKRFETRTIMREQLASRIECLREEQFELLLDIIDMEQRETVSSKKAAVRKKRQRRAQPDPLKEVRLILQTAGKYEQKGGG